MTLCFIAAKLLGVISLTVSFFKKFLVVIKLSPFLVAQYAKKINRFVWVFFSPENMEYGNSKPQANCVPCRCEISINKQD